ncbi:glycosyltransferase family 4 protein [Pontibacter roseus]|uniref:glycosyltransferase family 4 protein n=1 Tax=Pontibacter roseus TaxID=336989 RepID=UPI00037160BB|nr:glycosyltransferase family 4 protein [Pontibacter roseus]
MPPVLIRITTVPLSLQKLITGQLPYMRSKGFEPLMVSAPGPESQAVMKEQQTSLVEIRMTRKITPVQDLRALWQFYRLCKRYKPAIVHSHTPKAGIIGMLGAKLAGVTVRLHTVAGLPLMETQGKKRHVLEAVERVTYACATKVYPNSTVLKDFILQSRFCGLDKVKVIGNGSSNGIDTRFFCPSQLDAARLQELRASLSIQPENFVFVFIGRLVRDKGVQELVTAFTKLQQSHPQVKLLLVGPFEQDLDPVNDRILKEIERNPAILSVGFQHDVRPYLAISQALAFPSYREGFPNVPMQAGCFGLPSIVTDINGCNEIVRHGENGLIIPPKSMEELYNAMLQFITDKESFVCMQSKARQMIVDRYEQSHFWELLLQEYQDHLKQHEGI